MAEESSPTVVERLRAALAVDSSSVRLQTAMAAGLRPKDAYIDVLVQRCAVEPDFFVRDMLTWALIRHDGSLTMERVLPELQSVFPQSRAQALHTLSKLGDSRAWPAITDELLYDSEDEVARTAWRTAATLVPPEQAGALAERLSTQFARGDRVTQRSLSRALAMLEDAALPVVERAERNRVVAVRAHAVATRRLIVDPDEGFDVAIAAAHRIVALRGAPLMDDVPD